MHGQSADQVLGEFSAHVVGNNHHSEEGNQRGEDQAVNKDDQPGLFQVTQLGMFDFPVNLRKRLFAAHGQHRMSQPYKNCDQRDRVRPLIAIQPAKRSLVELHVLRQRRGRKVPATTSIQGVEAPSDQDNHHDGGELHDTQRLSARFRDAFDIFPPEIKRDHDGNCRRSAVHVEMNGNMREDK